MMVVRRRINALVVYSNSGGWGEEGWIAVLLFLPSPGSIRPFYYCEIGYQVGFTSMRDGTFDQTESCISHRHNLEGQEALHLLSGGF